MSPTLLGASVVASFFGGVLALIAPCCVSFVFPAYFASAFKEKSKILLMTFIFFIGMALVLVPVGLGVSAIARTIARFHYQIFLFGGILLIILAILTLMGKTLPMPFKHQPNLKKSDPLSIFLLGVVSGAASSCCTPVLIGVLTFSAMSGKFIYALILSLTYVFGMVFPLFIMSYFWDRYDFSKSKWVRGRLIKWSIMGKKYYIHSTHLIAAIIFGGMGILIVGLSLTGKTWTGPRYLAMMSSIFEKLTVKVIDKTKVIPEFIWVILFLIILSYLVWQAIKFSRKEK